METLVIVPPTVPSWLAKSPLAPLVATYWRSLVEQGYAETTRRTYLRCVTHFARWLRRRRGAASPLSEGDVARFLDAHLPACTCPSPVPRGRREVRAALRHFLATVRAAGVAGPPVHDAVEDEVRRFDAYLHEERGLAATTRVQRCQLVRHFLRERRGRRTDTIRTLDAGALRQFLARRLARWSPASAHVLTSTLRSYLRFRAGCGDQVTPLLSVIAAPASWRLASLPATLSAADVTRLLAAFPPDLPSGRRAFAMVRCVVDLGLRAREVVGLRLDDIDWRAGTLRIVGAKSRRADLLPLPAATGEAIAVYVQDERPRTRSRRLFVRHVAPAETPIGPDVVRRAVRAAYGRGGLPYTRVHVLRHTLASRLLERGSTLKEIADVLRHRDLDTTLLYTKIDTARLAAVALPWPGSAP